MNDIVDLDGALGHVGWSSHLLSLGEAFCSQVSPDGIPAPHWIDWSPQCAQLLGLPTAIPEGAAALDLFSGNRPAPGLPQVATVYSGHQFGVWAGQLGDGRAIWIGEIDRGTEHFEVQLKGAGRTPYSRMGDGRAVLRSSIREFLASEAMAALGIPTTRALCLTGSALPVRREQVETAAVVTRVAPSFMRFGHFEHFAHTEPDPDMLRRLVDHLIEFHHPDCRAADEPVLALLERVTLETARLMAMWQSVGFCHGVMNTDNMSMLGLTLDYGPFGFLDAYDPGHICNHSDHQGRYAFAQQPGVAFWNLHALAEAMFPLVNDREKSLSTIGTYREAFPAAYMKVMRSKLGLAQSQPDDHQLIDGLLKLMADSGTDHTAFFRRLCGFSTPSTAAGVGLTEMFRDPNAFDGWLQRYSDRLQAEGSEDGARQARMLRTNPKFILRNHLAEVAIRQAQGGDFSEVQRLREVLSRPFDDQPEFSAYADLPPAWASDIEVSCSS